MPGLGEVEPPAVVRAYPIIERWRLLWIWMGDQALADPALIPEFSFMNPAYWYVGNDYLEVEANYVLESDNILDLSHIPYLHPSTLGSGVAGDGKTVATQEGKTVWSRRFIRDETLPPFLYDALGIPHGTQCDRWLDVRWDAPALMWLQADIGREPTCLTRHRRAVPITSSQSASPRPWVPWAPWASRLRGRTWRGYARPFCTKTSRWSRRNSVRLTRTRSGT